MRKSDIIKSFNKGAASYEEAAKLQAEVGSQLLKLAQTSDHSAKIIYDLGCGTGNLTYSLAQHFNQAKTIGIDIASNMIKIAKANYAAVDLSFICEDIEHYLFNFENIDLVFSNLMLQWVNLANLLPKLQRALKPNGKLIFSIVGANSLYELKNSWEAIDQYPHVHNFISQKTLKNLLLANEFHCYQFIRKLHTRFFPTCHTLLQELKLSGVHNLHDNRKRGLLGKNSFKQFINNYEQYRCSKGLPLTYQIYYITAGKVPCPK
ncbi:MAG: malonyl-ACP O-methyltransferase BioC [Gammaproteobacteria bacterium]|nr:malonyl-ACP O-methyltransferase BioC [Gammaproteobacteria bacterium]